MVVVEAVAGTTKTGVVPAKADRARGIKPPGTRRLHRQPLNVSLEDGSQAVGQRTHSEVRLSDHRLESRMREIRQSGSGEGAANRIAVPISCRL